MLRTKNEWAQGTQVVAKVRSEVQTHVPQGPKRMARNNSTDMYPTERKKQIEKLQCNAKHIQNLGRAQSSIRIVLSKSGDEFYGLQANSLCARGI